MTNYSKKIIALMLMSLLALMLVACDNTELEAPNDDDIIAIESLEIVANANQTVAEQLTTDDVEDLEKSLTMLQDKTIPTLEQMQDSSLSGENLTKAYQVLVDETLTDANNLIAELENILASGQVDEVKVKDLQTSTKDTKENITQLLNQ